MTCLCATTRLAARRLTRLYEESLRPVGITPAQFELLSQVAARTGCTQAALADLLSLDQTTLSRNLKLLVGRGCLQRAPSTSDRRQSGYTLTPAGRDLWQAALPLWEEAQARMQRALGTAWEPLWTALAHLNRAADTA